MRKSSEVLSQIYSDKNKNAKNNKRKKSSEVLAEKGIDFNTIKQQKDTSGLFQKSDGNFIQSVGGTVGDLASDIGEGFFSAMEGIADWGQYRVADAFDLFGADKPANAIRDNAKFNSTAAIFGKNEDVNDNLFGKGWTDTLEKNSVLGDTADVINQGIGQVGAMAATAAVGGAIIGGGAKAAGMAETAANINKVRTVASALTSYTSAYGNARSEAYRNGADDSTANKTAMISGFSEAIAEQFFEGLPGIKVEGWADKVTGKMAGGLEKAFGTKIGRTFMKVSDALGEGAEEMISNALQATGNNIVHFFDRNYTYGMENQSGNVFKDFVDAFTSEDSVKSFFSAAMTSALIGGGNTFLTTAQKNTIINEYAKENNMSAKEAKTMLENTVMAETQAIAGKENFSDKMDVMDNIQKQELQNMKRNVFVEQGQRDKPFEYKETDNEQVNNMLKSLSEKGNNTTENHITAQIAEKLIRDLGYDVEYTNNDELVNSGREANAAGWKEGNKLVLNLDSNELDSFILGHESGHFFENQGDLYKAVSDTLFELAESKGIHKQELERHKKLYANYINNKIAKEETNLGRKLTEEEKTAIEEDVIKRELTADYIGSFFTDRDFFESLGKKNPTILQKFYDFIEDLINKLPGRQYQAKLKEAKNLIREVYNSYSEGGVINDSNSIDADIVKNEAITEQKQEEGINIPTAQETKIEQAETSSEIINLPTAEKIETKENNNLDEYLKIKNEYDNTNDSNRKAELETKLMELEDKLTQKELRQISKTVKLESKSENVKNVEKNVDNVENLPTKTKIDNQKGIENIKNKYDAAEKIDGAKKTIVLANGEKLTGTYKLLEAGNVAASHNAETFTKTEGFPTTEKGTTVNDRDYQSDRQAQQLVTQKSLNYDGRAFADNGVIVTKDGIVVSGNDRTMSGDLAAKSNKDSKYIEYLKDNAEQFGFTTEQIESMNHPRVVLELNETLDYDTKTFAKFNKDSKKSKSVAEKAKEIGKTIDNNTIESISDIIDKFETIDELYNNDKATRELLSILQTKGILDSNEISEVYNGSKFTGTGKDLVESVVLGSVISEENAKYFSNNNDLKFKVMKVAPAIIQNKTLNEYSINDILNDAIEVYKKASSSDMTIDEFTGQYNIFGDNDVDLVTKRIAQLLETRGYKNLRNFLDKYNAMAELPATGQIDIFSSNGVETREDVLNKALNIDDNTEIQYLLSGINSNMSLTKEKKLIAAQKLKEKHLKNKFIWALTGWNLDNADGNWKYEIKDAKLKKDIKLKEYEKYTLGEILDADELFKAYPYLKDVSLMSYNNVKDGTLARGTHFFSDGMDYLGISSNLKGKEFNSTLNHEIQHIIQRLEGFAGGANTEFYIEGGKFLGKDVDSKFGYELYKRTAGEVESRNVQGRMNLNPIEKRLKSFNETRDVKDKDIITRESMQEAIDRKKAKMNDDVQYMLSEDNKGHEIPKVLQERMKDSKARDEEGRLKQLYHGTATGEFYTFDKTMANPEGDWGAGFYLTDNESDVGSNYEDGGPDFENRIARLAEQISDEQDIEYDEAEEMAREELYKGSYKITAYGDMKNPAYVGKTYIFNQEDYYDNYNMDDYESEDDYYADVEQSIADDIDSAIWAIQREYDIDYYEDEIRNKMWEAYYNGGMEIEEFKNSLQDIEIDDGEGRLANHDVARIILESLGYDGIIDDTVSTKWNMNMESGTTHYIFFKENQIKDINNDNPTDNNDIRYLLSDNEQNDFDKYISGYIQEIYKNEDRTPINKTAEELRKELDSIDINASDEEWSRGYSTRTKLRAVESGYNSEYDYYVGEERKRLLEEYDKYGENSRAYRTIQEAKKQEEKNNKLQQEISESTPFKNKQYEIIQKTNPMFDEYHVGIRSPKDIKTWSEAMEQAAEDGEGYSWGDFNEEDAEKALNSNRITIYSSYPIKNGVFVSTSYIQAEQYAGGPGSKVYSKMIRPESVAWISVDEGQYAKVNTKYLLSDEESNRLPLYESKNKLGNELTGRTVEVPGENLPTAERPNLQVKEGKQYQTALPGFKEMEVGTPTRHEIITKFRDLAKNELGDITKIKDKKKGILYQINTMKRNLRDIMSPEQAKTMYDTYFKPITENNAAIENDITSYNERIQKYNLTNEESVYTQLVGELKYNPESELTSKKVEEYFNKNSKKIDKEKVNKAVEEFRNIYDELIGRINDTLVENGYKPIEYRKGYFPHFIEEKATSPIGKLAEKLGWRIKSGTLPTDIAGITDQFKPGKAWTSFSQQRTSDATDYNALKGLDNYIRGAMDVIHHTEDIQKLRALENEIRYQYSDKGIQQKIDDIYLDDDLDAEEKDNAIYQLTKDFRNASLGNFATEIRNYTDNLANKKSFGDRSMEQSFGRDTYSIMQNINSRVSANMVGANISSAMTNFIPITQAWSQVSTKNLMKGIYESVKTSIKDDGFADNSVYLTNRTKQADRLFKTGLDKVNDKLGVPFEAIDSFTSNTIVRAKYYDNLEKGMSEKEAMSNADEFAKDVMAGRSKGDMPTVFNQKNPITKLFTAFQLEVNNQYGYMFKDIRADLGGEAKDKIAAAFIKMFLGAYLYNMLSEKITGRKSAFSPIDMAIDDIKTATNDNMDIGDKISSIAKETAKELPFVGGLMGGGRLPLQGAIPYNNPLEMVTETISDTSKVFDSDESKKKTAINNLVKEWSKPLYYVAMPFAGGQIKKTVEGLSMYNENLPVAGSYTNSGKLRFEADDSTLGKLQAAVFGQYASKNAREYFENGYSPLTEKQVNTALESGLSIDEYREYNSGINTAKKIAKENNNSQTEAVYDYITNLPLADNQKNTLLNSALGNSDTVKDKNGYIKYVDNKNRAYWYDEENNTLYNKNYYEVSTDKLNELTKYSNKKDISNYSEYNSLEEFNYATKNPEKYAAITQISDFNSYNSYKDEIDAISEKYSDLMDNATNSKQKSAISNRKKQEIFGYINSLNLNKYQKTMLYKLAGGYSIKNYKNDMFNYINSLELTAEEKQTIYNELFD